MRKDLRLDKRTLSKSKRQKFSAADNRISSVSIGIVGASVLISALLMIILPDCMKVCRTVLKMKE
ncbi:hypothetical protein FSP39_001717 [Pinctada imbricata]|uniref:Uncharacterized protein n=1 Tax=Pinctada imbricata TaxID=66713 RepID=A0AA88YK67_PINIB|nr:hypothetical protein FSP39_001717 [Pinctada imbricata]